MTYDGQSPWAEKSRLTYLRISDCQGTIQLHKTDFDTDEDFCLKLETLEKVLRRFRKHLKRVKYEIHG